MSQSLRPRRSVLYMPGSNERALEKAQTLPVDALILDLEDAVAPSAKADARARVAGAVLEGGFGKREVIVRINALETPWGEEDLEVVADARPDGILIPKVNSGDDLQQVAGRLSAMGIDEDVKLWAMMETPLGILNAPTIAQSTPRLAAFVMGTNDLTKDLQARFTPDRSPMLTSIGLCLLAARAADIALIDGVHGNLADLDEFEAECVQGRDMGLDGKTLIHPKQVDICNRIFAPDPDELEKARAVISAWDAAQGEGKAVVVVDGKMVEELHVHQARRLVAMAGAIAAAQ